MRDRAKQLESELRVFRDRYEKIRKLTPMQFQELYIKHLKQDKHVSDGGKSFDEMVDEL